MKKTLVLLTLTAFLFSGTIAFAASADVYGGSEVQNSSANAQTNAQASSNDNGHGNGVNKSKSIAGATGTGNIGDINSGNSNKGGIQRSFPVPGTARFGPVINYYGKPLPGSQFRPVESLLMYANIFSEGALESIIVNGKNADLIVDLNVVRDSKVQARAKYAEGETRWIKIVATTAMQADHGLIGYVTSEADDRKTDMMEVIAGAALAALKDGADVLQIVAQGAARDTETSGWGIGFNTTQATMLSGGSVGSGGANVSSGGTGYSTAWAGMRDKPWLQANALKSPTKVVGIVIAQIEDKAVAPVADKAVAPAKKVVKAAPAKQTGNHTSAGSTVE